MKLTFRLKGGKGSGHFGHAGRPGKQGGALPDGESAVAAEEVATSKTGLPKKMTSSGILEWFQENGLFPDHVIKTGANKFRVEREYFYTFGKSAQDWADEIYGKLGDRIQITSVNDTYRKFVGGKKGSTFDVDFEIMD